MTTTLKTKTNIRQENMPESMRTLLHDYPRDGWFEHPDFKQATKNWLGAHEMFRRLSESTCSATERFLDKTTSADAFVAYLTVYGDALVRNLHGHHGWEDRVYFPELSAADPRFDSGLKILERDHQALDDVLEEFVDRANRTIRGIRMGADNPRDEAGRLLETAQTIQSLLTRHLADEEDLAVPIILHHKLRT